MREGIAWRDPSAIQSAHLVRDVGLVGSKPPYALDQKSRRTRKRKRQASSSRVSLPVPVFVAVEDTGTGLGPATADRIFDPFFTTKLNGLGMGLSICRSIINAHGGRFWVSPGALSGAVFRFTVPGVPSS
ncbi:Histidine kinase-, DNA gyrase B-, and HSP90-like ATPase [Rhizobiales bacterium GAS191]|nr:Histidine kinase-, DNA gyrase B-, and HSP90-like ATPase [Rhizobiales bacterium GAS191]